MNNLIFVVGHFDSLRGADDLLADRDAADSVAILRMHGYRSVVVLQLPVVQVVVLVHVGHLVLLVVRRYLLGVVVKSDGVRMGVAVWVVVGVSVVVALGRMGH